VTSSSEKTTALIAEARAEVERAAQSATPNQGERIRAGESDDVRLSLLVRLADALEAATSPTVKMVSFEPEPTARVVSTVAELDALGGNSVLYSRKAWAVLRKQYNGNDWVTDHASHQRSSLPAADVLEWTQDWEILRVGVTHA